jgi:hypothetical protein
VRALLVHGMFRTPVAMALLGHRLQKAGLDVSFFGYSVVWETTEQGAERLCAKAAEVAKSGEGWVLVAHSLGAVLGRMAFPRLGHRKPTACLFLAPPSRACMLAKLVHGRTPLFRWLTRDAGQLLADPAFMSALAVPEVPIRIYAGTAGPKGRLSPFGNEPNDGILTVEDTRIGAGETTIEVPAIHTLIMNSELVARDIAEFVKRI